MHAVGMTCCMHGRFTAGNELGFAFDWIWAGVACAELGLPSRPAIWARTSNGPVWLCNWVAVMDLQTWVRIGLLNGP